MCALILFVLLVPAAAQSGTSGNPAAALERHVQTIKRDGRLKKFGDKHNLGPILELPRN